MNSQLGRNKKQEVERLVYEISKRENISPESIIQNTSLSYHKLKHILLKRRHPLTDEISKVYLPKLKLDPSAALNLKKKIFNPKKIFVEKSATTSIITRRFRKAFPKAKLEEIKSLKQYMKSHRNFKVKDYNQRNQSAFITYENYDFFKKCPCTKKAIRCGYHIFNLSFGCIFECTYCYLQEYTNTPGIIFPANIDRFFNEFPSYKKSGMRIGTGEFSDSLMLDHITEYSLPIIEFFKKHPRVQFEFKTKSTNIDNLLKAKHAGNIVVSWSLNPQRIIDENEFFTPSLKERLWAAEKCAKAGYKIGIHFDPVVYYEGWQKDYEKVIDMLFRAARPKDIAWISIGTLRFNPKVKQIVEMRFPENKILDEELVLGFDKKLRYPAIIRNSIYQSILSILLSHSKKLNVYLCMEDVAMWQKVKLVSSFQS